MHRSPRQSQFWRVATSRRLISLLVVLGIVCAYLPLPVVSTGAPGKDTSRPFPCQQRTCGCRSAEQCWKSCCCFTNTEKVAWAEANQVELPTFVLEAADREQQRPATVAKAACGSPGCEHCDLPETAAKRSAAPSGASIVVRAEGADAEKSSTGDAPTAHRGAPADESNRGGAQADEESGVVVVSAALACQGLQWQWSALPPAPSIWWQVAGRLEAPAGAVVSRDSLPAGRGAPRPPVPPPRGGVVRPVS